MMKKRARLDLALIHHPVLGKRGEEITTSITPFDLHDIARSCRTFGVHNYWIVSPVESQRELSQRILGHWQTGIGSQINPSRQAAFERVRFVGSIQELCLTMERETASFPSLVATSAKVVENSIAYEDFRKELFEEGHSLKSYLLLFGTGWGLTPGLLEQCDRVLKPIFGFADYNHLSVRSAVAILLDRLNGCLENSSS